MAVGFPPQPVYPDAIDSDFTLFLVHNTAESLLTVDNQPWSEEIEILPVEAGELEVWADNGFGTIEGELFYYDAVEKNINGKVFKLKRIARNLSGSQTKFNPACVMVRGFVVAEHHNQLVDAVCRIEKFVGINFSTDVDSLDFRIRCLRDVPVCLDDACPSVIFNFDVTEDSEDRIEPCEGTEAEYSLEISGAFNSFQIDFGDGTSTTTIAEGTHVFPINSQIDPIVTVTSNTCQIVQSPVSRVSPVSVVEPVEDPFEIPIPECPPFPEFSCTPIDVPAPEVDLPQIVFPCIDLNIGDIGDINIPDFNIPSVIRIEPPIPSLIEFGPAPFIPSIIEFGPVPSFAPIEFADPPSFAPIEFATPPNISVCITIKCPSVTTSATSVAPFFEGLDDEFWLDESGWSDKEEALLLDPGFDVEDLGIPSEIKIIPPEIPNIEMVHDLPEKINLQFSEKIPDKIELAAPESPIKLDVSDIPEAIKLEVPKDFPKVITLDASGIPEKIQVVGVPSTIEILHDIPDKIEMVMPENPKVEMVYEGSPIDVKIDLNVEKLMGEGEEGGNCVMIVPCPKP
jgi:hypothetical protein